MAAMTSEVSKAWCLFKCETAKMKLTKSKEIDFLANTFCMVLSNTYIIKFFKIPYASL